MEVPCIELGWFLGMNVGGLSTGGDIKTVKS
jgi:hypothetical protein